MVESWAVPHVAAAVRVAGEPVAAHRPCSIDRFRLASISKVHHGIRGADRRRRRHSRPSTTLSGPPGCTVRHLLAHAGGLPFDGPKPIAPVRRSADLLQHGLRPARRPRCRRAPGCRSPTTSARRSFEPLGMHDDRRRGLGRPRASVRPLTDLDAVRRRTASSRRCSTEPAGLPRATAQFPDLSGVVPGVGRFHPCPWGLGPELRGDEAAALDRHRELTGHVRALRRGRHVLLGRPGDAPVALVVLTDREFGDWALRAWPAFSDTVLASVSSRRPSTDTRG